MGIIASIKSRFGNNETVKDEVNLKAQSAAEEFYLNDPRYIDYLIGNDEISEAVFSVVNRIANTFASLPLKMIDVTFEQPTDCAAFNILSEGPRFYTKFDFFRDIETIKNLEGNAYVQLFKNINGEIVDMALIQPGRCRPILDTNSGTLYYQVNSDSGKMIYVHYMDMLHFKHIRYGGIVGQNPLKVLSNTLNYDKEVQKISLKQLNGTNEGLKLSITSNMNEDEKEAVIKNIAKFYQENGGLLVEENGAVIERLKRDLVDTNLMGTDKVSRSKIAMVYNVPEHFVGGEKSSYNSQEQLNMEFLTYHLVPNVNQYESELNKKTLTPVEKKKGYRYKFNVAGLLRADTQTRGAFYQIMRRGGAYSANDVRMFEDMQPIDLPGMSEYHISGDLYPIGMDPTLRKTNQSKSSTD